MSYDIYRKVVFGGKSTNTKDMKKSISSELKEGRHPLVTISDWSWARANKTGRSPNDECILTFSNSFGETHSINILMYDKEEYTWKLSNRFWHLLSCLLPSDSDLVLLEDLYSLSSLLKDIRPTTLQFKSLFFGLSLGIELGWSSGYKVLSKAGKFVLLDIDSNEFYDEGPWSTLDEARKAANEAGLTESKLTIVGVYPPPQVNLDENRRRVNAQLGHVYVASTSRRKSAATGLSAGQPYGIGLDEGIA